jgi:hypothetical protein
MLAKVLIAIAILIVVVLVVASLQPSHYRIERSIVIAAPAAVPFHQVNDLQTWNTINPWAKLDPTMKSTYSGPRAGVGASFGWVGNHQVGTGSMTIVDSRPGEQIRMRMDFEKPFASTATAEFFFRPQASGTEVTWSMSGENLFIGKLLGLVVSMDTLIGRPFEQGLADLKTVSESTAGK